MRSYRTHAIALSLYLSAALCAASAAAGAETISLAGPWRFRLDPSGVGVAAKWYAGDLSDRLNLPGSLQEQNFGDEIGVDTPWVGNTGVERDNYPDWFRDPLYEQYRRPGHIRFPYWLQPKKHYVGPAWYQRGIDVPASWQGQQVTLTLERCHGETRLWIDNREIGMRDSLATPHVYDLSDTLSPGRHRLTLRVDNRLKFPIGANAHCVSDQTQTAWNGVVGKIALEVRDPVGIDEIQIDPHPANKMARVRVLLANRSGGEVQGMVRLVAVCDAPAHQVSPWSVPVRIPVGTATTCAIDYPMGDGMQLWDEFQPALYHLQVRLEGEGGRRRFADARVVDFGMRRFAAQGTRFTVNGRPVFLRGTLECCIFPRTGYPPTDLASWKRIMTIAKAYGLNHMRFHSWCPPEAAFAAADEAGVYLQPEVGLWAGVSKSSPLERFLSEESARILRCYGNHPSFTMLALGNESYLQPGVMSSLLDQWRRDDRHLYAGPANANGNTLSSYDYYIAVAMNKQRIRYQFGWPPKPAGDWFAAIPPQTSLDFRTGVSLYDKPLIAHETVQRCSYPDLDQARKYTGSLRASYLDIARDQLRANGLLNQAKDFLRASGCWQVQFFKEEIEAGLRTPGLGGFDLLQLHDFPGQGAALVGVLDAFWDSKGYIRCEDFRRFCAPVVPLARLEKRVFTSSEKPVVRLEVANFSSGTLRGVAPRWRVFDSRGQSYAQGTLPARDIPVGGPLALGTLELSLAGLPAPAKYRLVAALPAAAAANDWDFWVYPEAVASETGDVVVAGVPDRTTLAQLDGGAKVLLLPGRETLAGNIPQCFTPIYWNAPYTNGGDSQTLGLLCDPAHPLFSDFPTDFHCNWQWHELLATTRPMVLAAWPKPYRPLVQLIDDWNQNRLLAVVAEACCGKGRLVICSLDIQSNLASRPVARQFRASLFHYMNGPQFRPAASVTANQLQTIFRGGHD